MMDAPGSQQQQVLLEHPASNARPGATLVLGEAARGCGPPCRAAWKDRHPERATRGARPEKTPFALGGVELIWTRRWRTSAGRKDRRRRSLWVPKPPQCRFCAFSSIDTEQRVACATSAVILDVLCTLSTVQFTHLYIYGAH